MEVFPTLFAKVFVGAGSFFHDADTAAVLPDFANVALYEQTACIIALKVRICHRGQLAISELAGIRGWTRILLLATHATCDLILLGNVVVELVVQLREVIAVVVVLARSAPCQGRFCLQVARRLGFVGLFRRERMWGQRLVRR